MTQKIVNNLTTFQELILLTIKANQQLSMTDIVDNISEATKMECHKSSVYIACQALVKKGILKITTKKSESGRGISKGGRDYYELTQMGNFELADSARIRKLLKKGDQVNVTA